MGNSHGPPELKQVSVEGAEGHTCAVWERMNGQKGNGDWAWPQASYSPPTALDRITLGLCALNISADRLNSLCAGENPGLESAWPASDGLVVKVKRVKAAAGEHTVCPSTPALEQSQISKAVGWCNGTLRIISLIPAAKHTHALVHTRTYRQRFVLLPCRDPDTFLRHSCSCINHCTM